MSLQALQSYIIDSVVNNQPFDLVHYIESQYIQEKNAFDEDFKVKVGSLLDDSEDIVNENVLAWAKFQVECSFEVKNKFYAEMR